MPTPAWLALLALLAAGCEKTVEFRPYDADAFYQRRVMMLDAKALPPLPEAILDQVWERVESALAASPYLGEVLTRQAMREATATDRVARANYDLLSETATVLGITDREITMGVVRAHPADLLASVQVLHLPCPGCEQDDRIAVVAQIFDTKRAELQWRAHLSRSVIPGVDDETLAREAEALTGDLLKMLEHLLKPKPHRLRFEHLKRHPAAPQA